MMDILPRQDIDLVDVCTPPFVHAQISINALRSGKKLSIIAQNRFRKPIRDLKPLLDSGIAGPVRHAEIDSFWWRAHNYYDLWWPIEEIK